mmetsp:Transcript_36417/g.58758  ORF Transcript_36417/g.58758 Transcript_36417/m.58758 type:complete len:383 (+) Transcript_36417:56-1204(+)
MLQTQSQTYQGRGQFVVFFVVLLLSQGLCADSVSGSLNLRGGASFVLGKNLHPDALLPPAPPSIIPEPTPTEHPLKSACADCGGSGQLCTIHPPGTLCVCRDVCEHVRRHMEVLPEVTGEGTLTQLFGWSKALLTCSVPARTQFLLNERLWLAAAHGYTQECKELLDRGADILSEPVEGSEDPRQYFYHLYGLTFYEEYEHLMQATATGTARDPRETKKPRTRPPRRVATARTALRWAAYNGHADTVDLLVRRGADVNSGDPSEGYTALHEAALYGHLSVVKVLLAREANVNPQTEENWLPLHLAAAYGRLQIVKTLQKAGADLCATTEGGLTAMDWAKAYGYTDAAEFLRTCSGERHGNCEVCGRCNFFIQGGIASKVSSM